MGKGMVSNLRLCDGKLSALFMHTLFFSKELFGIKIGTMYTSIHRCTKKGIILNSAFNQAMICQVSPRFFFICGLQTAT